MKCAGNRVRNPSFGLFWSLERRTAAGRPNGVALGMDVETSSNRESALEIHCWLSLAARLGSSVASILPQLTCVYTHHLERTRPVVFTSVNIQFRKKKKFVQTSWVQTRKPREECRANCLVCNCNALIGRRRRHLLANRRWKPADGYSDSEEDWPLSVGVSWI